MLAITSDRNLLWRVIIDLCVGMQTPSRDTRLTSGCSMFWVTKEDRSTMARLSRKEPLHSILYIGKLILL